MANEEQVGFHKGALTTLAKERQELVRMLQIVEQLMQAHLKALKDLGVDLEAEAKSRGSKDPRELENAEGHSSSKAKPLEEAVKRGI